MLTNAFPPAVGRSGQNVGMEQLSSMRFVATGGVIGALLRCLALASFDDGAAPLIIFVLNVVGSLLLGVFVGLRVTRAGGHRLTRNQFLLAGTGFCGALTTFSTFALQVANHLDDGAVGPALSTGFATPMVAMVLAGIGYRLGSRP